MNNKAFTLIELLVVIAILAVLAVAVTLILNPAELIRQGRDSIRLSDLATINKALGLYQTDQIAKWMGTSTIVYTSLPDTDSTCSSYGLPSLPSGWTYNCETTTTYTNVDGTGWLPVNFTSMSFSSPLARLPVDPVNNATSSKYYTYVTGGSWELSAVMEAVSNKLGGDNDRVSGDGGEYADIYETGTNLELLPVNRNPNLVGYWKFDEGTGTNAYDASGNGNDGTLVNTPTWTTDAKKGDYALEFDEVESDYVDCGYDDSLDITNALTLSVWVYPTNITLSTDNNGGVGKSTTYGFRFYYDDLEFNTLHSGVRSASPGIQNLQDNIWHHIVLTFGSGIKKTYLNGVLRGTNDIGSDIDSNSATHFKIGRGAWGYLPGIIDEVRIYSRALSAAEIEAMYNSY